METFLTTIVKVPLEVLTSYVPSDQCDSCVILTERPLRLLKGENAISSVPPLNNS